MNKTIVTLMTFIQPGHPLMIIGGEPGCGKLNDTMQAIKEQKKTAYNIFLSMMEQDSFGLEICRKEMKSLYSNIVLVINEIEYMEPQTVSFVLEQMIHPERAVVLMSNRLDGCDKYGNLLSMPILNRCQIIKYKGINQWLPL
jgi:hypothetical protein